MCHPRHTGGGGGGGGGDGGADSGEWGWQTMTTNPVQHCRALGFAVLQVFDAMIIVASFVVDLVFLKGLQAFPLDDSIFILAFLLPWRVIRVVNSECTVLSFSSLPP